MLVLPVQLLPQVTSVQIELFLSKVESMKRWGLRRHDDFIWGHNLSDHRLPKGGNEADGKGGRPERNETRGREPFLFAPESTGTGIES